MRWAATLALLAGAVVACNTDDLLDVNVPDRVPANTFENPANATLMVNSAIADFECAFASFVTVEGVISDELIDAQLGAAAWPYDRRDANTQPGGSYGVNTCESNQTPGIYLPLSTARWGAETGLRRLQEWTDEQVANRQPLMARAAMYTGFSYAALGMSMCEAAFDLEAQIDQPAMFGRAEAAFTTALDAAGAAGLDDVVNASYVGRARVRLFLGKLAEAAADAAQVPPGFVFEATMGSDDNRRYNRVYASTAQFGFYSVDPRARAFTTEGVPDPRATVILTDTRAADSETPIYAATKYTGDASPIRVASYDEAQLILAEAQGGTEAVNIINAMRDDVGLPHYTGPTDAASIRNLIIEERRRVLFLEGFRNYDIQRFELPLIPAPGTEYPDKGGVYGNTTCLPLPDIERFNNPNIP
jgi:hypothetical protein